MLLSIDNIDLWFKEALKPDPILTVSEWADRYRMLSSKASGEPGKWKTSRTPYLKEIMDVLSTSHPCKKVVFKKSSQIGGTESGYNWLGYIIDHAPGPTMLIQPTVDTAKRNSKLRIEPLIEETPRLREKISDRKSKESSNTIMQKDFPGGSLIMTGANSAAGLRSTPCRYLMIDELDAYPSDVDGEGDPVSLAMARSRNFSRRKAILISTPGTKGMSKIENEFEDSDQRHYHVPCPFCSHEQVLKFEFLKWTPGKPETVKYYCEKCGEGIEERHKTKMLSGGHWIALNPGHYTVGFFINALYSPTGWHSWKEIATDYELAKKELETEKKHEKMKAFHNTTLGLSYEETGEAPEWAKIYHRRDKYPIGKVPYGPVILTCGADVQKDRIECEVVGWGKGQVSWSIDYRIFSGDTTKDDVWKLFEDFITGNFEHESGALLPLSFVAVDSGYNTQKVYNFCRKFPPNKVVPIKGMDDLAMIVGSQKAVDAKIDGKKIRRAVKLWNVGVSVLKTELYGRLKIDPPIGDEKEIPGYCHFPEYSDEYFKQLTSEKMVVRRNRKGNMVREWVKDRERNEALDCRIYARAAASLFGIDRFKNDHWDKYEIKKVEEISKVIQTKIESDENRAPRKKIIKPKPMRESSIW